MRRPSPTVVRVSAPHGLQACYVLFFIELKARRVHVAGITTNPTDWFIGKAVERVAGQFNAMLYVIHDRDTKYALRFRIVMEDAGVTPIKTPFQAPNANAYAERLVRSIKDECLNRMILFGEGHLRRAIDQYLAHYHGERNHQGLDNKLIDGEVGTVGEITSRERLGGLLRYYHRAA